MNDIINDLRIVYQNYYKSKKNINLNIENNEIISNNIGGGIVDFKELLYCPSRCIKCKKLLPENIVVKNSNTVIPYNIYNSSLDF